MTLGIALALTSAVAHATWNSITKRLSGGGLAAMWSYWVLSLVVLGVAMAGMTQFTSMTLSFTYTTLWAGAVSSIFHGVYFVSLITAYRHHDVSLVYPLSRGIAPVVVAGAAVVALGQVPGITTWVALACMGFAMWLIAGTAGESPQLGAQQHLVRGRLWGLVIGCGIAAYTVWDAWSIVSLGVDPVAYYMVLTCSQTVVLLWFVARNYRKTWEFLTLHPRSCVAVAVLMPTSYVSALFATQHIPVALMAAVRGSSVVWVALAAMLFLTERVTWVRACGVVVTGVAIVVMASD